MDKIETFYDEESEIWSGPSKLEIYHPDLSMGQLIYMLLRNWPKNILQINADDGRVIKSPEALTLSIRIAQHLELMGLGIDDIVGIVGKNSNYVMPVATACLFNTTPFNAINPNLEEKTLAHIFDLTKPKLIFCDGSIYKKIQAATNSFSPKIYTLVEHIEGVPRVEDLLEPTSTEFFYKPKPLVQGGDQTMVVLCSSGTTGLPKAVCLSHKHYMTPPNDTLNSEDVIYTASYLDWLSGILFYTTSMFLGCTRIISLKPFDPDHFVELVEKYKVSWSLIQPRQLAALTTCASITPDKVKSIKLLSAGGCSVSISTLNKAQAFFQNATINFGYGFTEFGIASFNYGVEHTTSIGKLRPGIQVRIVDDNGKNLGTNEIGEMYLRRPEPWAGYYNNPIETQKMLDSEGWLRSGDLAYFDDKHFLYVVDKKKEVLKYHELQYWPTEIEEVIKKMPGVADACVFGIYDERHGDAAAALVVLEPNSKVTTSDVKKQVEKELDDKHKHLHAGVAFTDKLPQNHNGKVLKANAKKLFLELTKEKDTN